MLRISPYFALTCLIGVAACGEASRPDVYEPAHSDEGGDGGRATNGAGASGALGGEGSGGTASIGGDTSSGGVPDTLGEGECPSPFTTVDISELEASEMLDPYAITGETAQELRQSLDANGPSGYDAYTSWFLTWQYANSDCDGSELSVTAEVTYILPEWEPPGGVTPELVEHWDTYMAALRCHEYGHAKLGLDAGNEVFSTLSAIDANGDCNEQQVLADAAFQSILADYTAREIEYDDDTQHGATMGATFP